MGLLSETDLKHLLYRERLRADRSGSPLCLVKFTPPSGVHRGRYHTALGRTLQRRLRSTDECGWLGQDAVGAVLPDTPEEGAWCVVRGVNDLLERQGLAHPLVDVFVYPWPADKAPVPDDIDDTTAPRRSRDMATFLMADVPVWKRAIDVMGALMLMLAFAPILLIVGLIVRLTSHGPVIYSQYREGIGGRRFLLYKFRTMYLGAERHQQRLRAFSEQDGPAFKMTNDPRVTPIGRWLRKTSLDELPQLWNVFRGEMSLVGPRPLPWEESRSCQVWQRRRLDVLPGITCIWQVRGRSRVTFSEWVRMDLQYISSRSFLSDLGILAQTIPAVLLQRGAS